MILARVLFATIALLVASVASAAGAEEDLLPREVAEAMRSCLPISDLRDDPDAPASRQAVAVSVADAPTFEIREQVAPGRPPEMSTRTAGFVLWRSDSAPNAEHYAHVRDPRLLLVFARYRPAQEIAEADQLAIRAFRDRVVVCFDDASGLDPREAEAVRWSDRFSEAYRGQDGLPITDFPGAILAPSRRVALFEGLRLGQAWLTSEDFRTPGVSRYEFVLGDRPSAGGAQFYGVLGRRAYDEAAGRPLEYDPWVGRPDQAPRPICDATVDHCAFPGVGYALHSELFFGLTVGSRPAVVRHVTCCNGQFWEIVWYDGEADVTRGYSLYLDVAERLGSNPRVDPDNVAAASILAGVAADLIPVRPQDGRRRAALGISR